MVANKKVEKITPENLSIILGNWFKEKKFSSIRMEENFNPTNDPYESYQVSYECRFLSDSYDIGFIEIWLTEEGALGIFIEKYQRIYLRLESKRRSVVFGWSQEPAIYNVEVVIKFLDIISAGKFKIFLNYIHVMGILNLSLFINDKDLNSIELLNETFSSRISPMSKIPTCLAWRKILNYKAWS